MDYVEKLVLRWNVWTTLNNLYYIETFELGWTTCATLTRLDYDEWFAFYWMICHLYLLYDCCTFVLLYSDRFYCTKWFVLHFINLTIYGATLNYFEGCDFDLVLKLKGVFHVLSRFTSHIQIVPYSFERMSLFEHLPFKECRVHLRKHSEIFRTKLPVDFFKIEKYI